MKKKQTNKRRSAPNSASSYWVAKQVFDDALQLQNKGRFQEAWKMLKPVAESDQVSIPILEPIIFSRIGISRSVSQSVGIKARKGT